MQKLFEFVKNITPVAIFLVGCVFSVIGTIFLRLSGKLHMILRTKTGEIIKQKEEEQKQMAANIDTVVSQIQLAAAEQTAKGDYFATEYKGPTGKA